MARLTLSEQNKQQAEEIARLQTAIMLANTQQGELDSLRKEVQELRPLRVKIEELLKAQKTADDASKYYSTESNKRAEEIEQCHAVLDAVDGVPAREYEQEYGKGKRGLVTRLAGAFLAIAREARK